MPHQVKGKMIANSAALMMRKVMRSPMKMKIRIQIRKRTTEMMAKRVLHLCHSCSLRKRVAWALNVPEAT